MKSFKSLYILLALVFISVAFMSFIPSANSINNKNNTQLVTPDPGETNDLSVGWKTVEVDQRESGNYYVKYSDIVSGMDPNNPTWGCGYLDIDPNTSGWNCEITTPYFHASGGDNCEYIYVHSYCTPAPGNPVTHTIDIKVRDSQGNESNQGGITLIIDYTANPSTSEPNSPCPGY